MNLIINCYAMGPTFPNENARNILRDLLSIRFPSERGIDVEVKMFPKYDDIIRSPLFDSEQEIEKVCSGMLNARYVTSAIPTIRKKGGIILQFQLVEKRSTTTTTTDRGYLRNRRDEYDDNHDRRNDRRNDRERDRSSRSRQTQHQVLSRNAALATLYNSYESDGGMYLYLSSLCALSDSMYKGIGARIVDFQKDIVTNSSFSVYAGATLDALLYCRKSTREGLNIRELDVGECYEWLHDYYISRGFELKNTDVIHDVLEYENDPMSPKGYNKKIKKADHKFVFDTEKVIPMIFRK